MSEFNFIVNFPLLKSMVGKNITLDDGKEAKILFSLGGAVELFFVVAVGDEVMCVSVDHIHNEYRPEIAKDHNPYEESNHPAISPPPPYTDYPPLDFGNDEVV